MLRKRFLDWTEPALPRLVATVAAGDELAAPPELDLRDHLFVFPGSRPSRRFLELLVEAAEDRGLRLTSPRAPGPRRFSSWSVTHPSSKPTGTPSAVGHSLDAQKINAHLVVLRSGDVEKVLPEGR